jgi:hypothetical protein
MTYQYIPVLPSSALSDFDYINFLIATTRVSCVKAADCLSSPGASISHDRVNRFLIRQSLPPETLWNEVKPFVEKHSGWLVLDDTVLDKIHSEKIELVYFQWSGKHRKVIKGIGLISLIWTDGVHSLPIAYRIYDRDTDDLTKNDHFRDMLQIAASRGFTPYFVMFDSWYSSLANLKFLRKLGWSWLTQVKKNRSVNPDDTENRPVSSLTIPDDGMVVHMKKFGFVKVFHSRNKAGRDRYWATNCLTMDGMGRKNLQAISWSIENYHRELKELCCIEKCQVRHETGQRNHINCSLRAFIRLKVAQILQKISTYEIKWTIGKPAIIEYLINPKYDL